MQLHLCKFHIVSSRMIVTKGRMNEIMDLNAEEIEVIAGAAELDQPTNVMGGSDYPIVVNNPP